MPHLVVMTTRSRLLLFFYDTAPTGIYTLSLHDALPISLYVLAAKATLRRSAPLPATAATFTIGALLLRSEEHTSELQSRFDLVCRLLLEKKKQGVTASLFRCRSFASFSLRTLTSS